jgi:hypothetical protein
MTSSGLVGTSKPSLTMRSAWKIGGIVLLFKLNINGRAADLKLLFANILCHSLFRPNRDLCFPRLQRRRSAHNLDNFLGNRRLPHPVHRQAQAVDQLACVLRRRIGRRHARRMLRRNRLQQRMKICVVTYRGIRWRNSAPATGRRCSPPRRCQTSWPPLNLSSLRLVDRNARDCAAAPPLPSAPRSSLRRRNLMRCPACGSAAASPPPRAARSPT